MRDALAAFEADPGGGKPYPAGYRAAARWGYWWVKVHRYWFAYAVPDGEPILTNVLFESADIPGRIGSEDGDLRDRA